ncbi:unnamed protein product [Meloidogyne enterolobii]|uniref:Uncharacterized protein n=1 Tax=Meloidogyne enterolobii TaxID=390850 RepID=A0ACB1B9M3_MELEN
MAFRRIYEDFKDARGSDVELFVRDVQVHDAMNGAFSFVYRATINKVLEDGTDEEPSQLVAIKRTNILKAKDFRELHILRRLSSHRQPHPNIANLMYYQRREVMVEAAYSLVFEFVPATLAQLKTEYFENRNVLDIKLCMWQLFAGLDHLKKLNIIHRDIKPTNLLVNPTSGRLTIADFGSAIYLPRYINRYQLNYIVDRFYRPPELILGAERYDCLLDVWSAGCVFAELYLGEALFKGNSQINQLQFIYTKLGTPTVHDLKCMRVDVDTFIPAVKSQAVNPFQELFTVCKYIRQFVEKAFL